MSLFGGGKQTSRLRLEDALFSTDELFALNNGFDNMYLTVDEDYFAIPDEQVGDFIKHWRDRVAVRMRGTGLVNEDGTPSDVLAHALEPLSAPGIAITDAPYNGKSGLFMAGDTWTIVRKAAGLASGWRIVPVDPSIGLEAAVTKAFKVQPVSLSQWESRGYIREDEFEKITDALNGGYEETLKSIAWLRGLPVEALLDVSKSLEDRKTRPIGVHLFGCDCTGAHKANKAGYNIPDFDEGYCRMLHVQVIPAKGFYLKIVTAPKPGDSSNDMFENDPNDERTYAEAGFVHEGSFYREAFAMPEWYPEDALAYRSPSGGTSENA